MQRLLDFPIEEPDHIEDLRAKSVKEHEDVASQIALGAALADILLHSGKPAAALEMHRLVQPNPGNAMAHELQFTRLLVATNNLDEAMRQAASTVITANKHRSGYSKKMKLEYIDQSADLAPLRERNDWPIMLNDPIGYLKESRGT